MTRTHMYDKFNTHTTTYLNINKLRQAESTQNPIISTHGPNTVSLSHTHITHVNTFM